MFISLDGKKCNPYNLTIKKLTQLPPPKFTNKRTTPLSDKTTTLCYEGQASFQDLGDCSLENEAIIQIGTVKASSCIALLFNNSNQQAGVIHLTSGNMDFNDSLATYLKRFSRKHELNLTIIGASDPGSLKTNITNCNKLIEALKLASNNENLNGLHLNIKHSLIGTNNRLNKHNIAENFMIYLHDKLNYLSRLKTGYDLKLNLDWKNPANNFTDEGDINFDDLCHAQMLLLQSSTAFTSAGYNDINPNDLARIVYTKQSLELFSKQAYCNSIRYSQGFMYNIKTDALHLIAEDLIPDQSTAHSAALLHFCFKNAGSLKLEITFTPHKRMKNPKINLNTEFFQQCKALLPSLGEIEKHASAIWERIYDNKISQSMHLQLSKLTQDLEALMQTDASREQLEFQLNRLNKLQERSNKLINSYDLAIQALTKIMKNLKLSSLLRDARIMISADLLIQTLHYLKTTRLTSQHKIMLSLHAKFGKRALSKQHKDVLCLTDTGDLTKIIIPENLTHSSINMRTLKITNDFNKLLSSHQTIMALNSLRSTNAESFIQVMQWFINAAPKSSVHIFIHDISTKQTHSHPSDEINYIASFYGARTDWIIRKNHIDEKDHSQTLVVERSGLQL